MGKSEKGKSVAKAKGQLLVAKVVWVDLSWGFVKLH